MSSRCREKYPQKIVGPLFEPMCQMQENYRRLTPKPHQGWLDLSLKSRDKSDDPRGNWYYCFFVGPFKVLKQQTLAGFFSGAGWGAGPVVSTEIVPCAGPHGVSSRKDCLSSESSQFIFNNWCQDLVLFACIRVWAVRTHARNLRAWGPLVWG